ncbi:hypothetical protein [Niastella sp. OAS944]|uniref:hypothetical protein n=1 Tax=Niastella sp. OAS944 TaxID=2664089 RepID=UPI00346CD815|nr:hypothetical protein [Chitinophagaceae bacterium OAS944]
MNNMISAIKNNVQDRNSVAWKRLCDYVEKIAAEGNDEFSPVKELGPELFSQIYTLPETIATLKKVKRVWLYGSKLKRIPPEIGEMESLEYFDPYTSYDLHWFPYEIINCKKLKDSRVSTRALYGNFKNRKGFPILTNNPVRYEGNTVKCSICKKDMSWLDTNQLWVSLRIGTDVLPLLVNVCSSTCEAAIPAPPKDYIPHAHKGGSNLKQLRGDNDLSIEEFKQKYAHKIIDISSIEDQNEPAKSSTRT